MNQVVERQKQIYQQMDSLSQGGAQSASAAAGAAGGAAAGASSDAGGSAPAAASATPSGGDENSDYNAAVSLALEKQYDQAISAFQSFVKQYPKSTYQPNANYWLGQLFYNKGKKTTRPTILRWW